MTKSFAPDADHDRRNVDADHHGQQLQRVAVSPHHRFTDTLPGTMRVAAPVTTGGTCLPPLAFTPRAGRRRPRSSPSAAERCTGATIGGISNANCTVTINVIGDQRGRQSGDADQHDPRGQSSAASHFTSRRRQPRRQRRRPASRHRRRSLPNADRAGRHIDADGDDQQFGRRASRRSRRVHRQPGVDGRRAIHGRRGARGYDDLRRRDRPPFPGRPSFSLPAGTTIPAAGSCTITVPVQVAANRPHRRAHEHHRAGRAA